MKKNRINEFLRKLSSKRYSYYYMNIIIYEDIINIIKLFIFFSKIIKKNN